MDVFLRGLADAFRLLWRLDPALLEIIGLTLRVTLGRWPSPSSSGSARAAAGLARRLPGRSVLVPIIYTGMGLPPVLVGLFAYLLLSNRGPLGFLGWLFTPTGMVLAQTIIALPLVIGLTMTAVQGVDPRLRTQLLSLGATRRQVALATLAEARTGGHRRSGRRLREHHLGGGGGDAGRREHRRGDPGTHHRHRPGDPPGQLRLGAGAGGRPARPGLHHQLRLLPTPGPAGGAMTHAYLLDGVQHCYGSRCVVDVPALEVRAGEILGIVGPSGAGKSTLLRLLNFLEPPTRGRLTYRGTEVGPEVPLALRREVVTVFQQPVLLRRSVLANVRIGQRLRGLPRSNRDAEQWLQRLGLSDLARAPARTLSAGEAQRVALAAPSSSTPRWSCSTSRPGTSTPTTSGSSRTSSAPRTRIGAPPWSW